MNDGPPLLTTVVLVAATLSMGLVAGVFALYSHTVMPGLRRTDDRTFVAAFQSIDRAIINPWFMSCFFGALLLSGVAAAQHLGASTQSTLPWIIAAFVLYLIVVVITLAVNVPLNDAVKAAGEPDHIGNLAEVRRSFNEAKWSAWNLVRTITTTVAFGILLGVLVADGRPR